MLFVHAIETSEIQLAEPEGPERFFNMPHEEAIAFFQAKEIISPAEFDRLSEEARKGAFIARNLMGTYLVKRAKGAIRSALEEGTTLREFAQEIRSGERDLGVAPASDHYLETVFRTNILDSYSQGKKEAAFSPAVKEARPYVVYRATMDGRTRPSHKALHNKAIRKDSNPRLPIWGYNCRCSFVSMSEAQIRERGYEIIAELPEIEGF